MTDAPDPMSLAYKLATSTPTERSQWPPSDGRPPTRRTPRTSQPPTRPPTGADRAFLQRKPRNTTRRGCPARNSSRISITGGIRNTTRRLHTGHQISGIPTGTTPASAGTISTPAHGTQTPLNNTRHQTHISVLNSSPCLNDLLARFPTCPGNRPVPPSDTHFGLYPTPTKFQTRYIFRRIDFPRYEKSPLMRA